MKKEYAQNIADLLNRRNKLDGEYSADRILESSNDYEFQLDESGYVISAVKIKKVTNWYQWELSHLSVHESHLEKGYGKKMIMKAEQKAEEGGARIIQCTIREDNEPSKHIFHKTGYQQVSAFYNRRTGNNVGVWQKILCEPIIK